jgi:hypothetical protein
MNIREALLQEHSKQQTLRIVLYIGTDKEHFKELVELFLGNNIILAQRASWALSNCVEAHPQLAQPYLKVIVHRLTQPLHNAVTRNVLRLLQFVELPEDLLGEIATICFKQLSARAEPVANRAFAMTVLARIAEKLIELQPELCAIIEGELPYALPAFVSRGWKILKRFKNR